MFDNVISAPPSIVCRASNVTFLKIYFTLYITNLTQYTHARTRINERSLHLLQGDVHATRNNTHEQKNIMLYEIIGDLHAPYSFVNGLMKYYQGQRFVFESYIHASVPIIRIIHVMTRVIPHPFAFIRARAPARIISIPFQLRVIFSKNNSCERDGFFILIFLSSLLSSKSRV